MSGSHANRSNRTYKRGICIRISHVRLSNANVEVILSPILMAFPGCRLVKPGKSTALRAIIPRQRFVEEYGAIISQEDLNTMQFDMRRYINDYLSNNPTPGFTAVGNISSSANAEPHDVDLSFFSNSLNCR